MNNQEKTLFIFEGASTEDIFIKKLEQNFLGHRHAIKCVFDAEIYQLYRAIKNEGNFSIDIVSLLKERKPKNAEALKDYNRDSFAYIYLFFDYDAHATLADDENIKEMLSFFNDETDMGMLYISYPMVEAMRHFKDIETFKTLTVKCKRKNCPYIDECTDKDDCLNEPHYKKFVPTDSKPQLSNINSYTATVWIELITAHLCKANYLINDIFELPTSLILQEDIFLKQLEKHINHKCPKVAVLSAFPFYVLDYFGCSKIMEKLNP
mgnify:CR=1 FL=1